MNTEIWKVAGDWAFVAIAISAVIFTALYLLLTPWWRTETSRNIMAMMSTLAVIGVWGTYLLTIHDNHRPSWHYQIRFFLLSTLAGVIIWRIFIFLRVQIIARRVDRKEKKDHDLRP